MLNSIIKFHLNCVEYNLNNTRCLEFRIEKIDKDFYDWLTNKKQIYLFNFSSKQVKHVSHWPNCFIYENRLAIYFMTDGRLGVQANRENKIMYLDMNVKCNSRLFFDLNTPSTTTLEELKVHKRNMLRAIILLKNKYLESV